jgi:trk system potassium uptake protein TrkA
VRGLKNSGNHSSIKTLYKIAESGDDYVEALEFEVKRDFWAIGTHLKNAGIKRNVLIGCVARSGGITIADGQTQIREGDTVIVLAKNENISELNDIRDGKALAPAARGVTDN